MPSGRLFVYLQKICQKGFRKAGKCMVMIKFLRAWWALKCSQHTVSICMICFFNCNPSGQLITLYKKDQETVECKHPSRWLHWPVRRSLIRECVHSLLWLIFTKIVPICCVSHKIKIFVIEQFILFCTRSFWPIPFSVALLMDYFPVNLAKSNNRGKTLVLG